MLPARTATACASLALALGTLSACGASPRPEAGSPSLRSSKEGGRGVIDDPRTRHMTCLRALHLPLASSSDTQLLLGAAPAQARVSFMPTPGAAQEAQISGQAQGAEVIGPALLFPGGMSDHQLMPIERCLAQGVKG